MKKKSQLHLMYVHAENRKCETRITYDICVMKNKSALHIMYVPTEKRMC